MKVALIVSTVIILATAAVFYRPEDPEKTAMSATFAVYEDTGHGADFICTATAFEPSLGQGYYLLTAGHCIAKEPTAKYSVSENIGSPRTEVRVTKYYVDSMLDFAVLDFRTPKKYPVIALGEDAEVGTKVLNPNFALGLTKQLSFGTVSSLGMTSDAGCDICEGKFIVQVTGARGSSGSAIISDGKIVGVLTNMAEDENIGLIAEPISAFQSFMGI